MTQDFRYNMPFAKVTLDVGIATKYVVKLFLALNFITMLPSVALSQQDTSDNSKLIQQQFAGQAFTREKAARIAYSAGFDLIDAQLCKSNPNHCARLAVRDESGAVQIHQITSKTCSVQTSNVTEKTANDKHNSIAKTGCFGGFKIDNQNKPNRGNRQSPGRSTAKIQGAPGKDGAPPAPEDDAQAEATNEIIEALGDGKYENEYDQFWVDLESIQEWNMPSWREPDPPPPKTIEGFPLPDALSNCHQERRALFKNEPKCSKPAFNPVSGGTCTNAMLPSFTPKTDNLVISNWDWDRDQFVYFSSNHADPTPEDVDLLTASWNFLVENSDIAEWVICLVEGPSNGNCIEKRLDGKKTQPFEFVDKLPIGCPKTAGMCTAFIGTKTSILMSSWEKSRNRFFNPATSDAEKFCTVARIASVFLHEMLHSCLAAFTQNADDFGVGPGDCGCDTPDMAESAFAWAIAKRYPCLANTQGCGFYANDNMWLTPCDFGYNCPPLCE